MAVTRAELKMLVKELLVEVLSEGLGNVQASAYRPPVAPAAPIRGAVRESRAPQPRRRPSFDPALDRPAPQPRPSNHIQEQIRLNSGGNPIMAAILADTAATTLQEQIAGERAAPGGGPTAVSAPQINQVEQIHGTPEEVFGEETASRWADLAFMPSKKTA